MQIKLESSLRKHRKKVKKTGLDYNIRTMRVFDFDDTIAETHSMVYVKDLDSGEERAITPAEFAVYEKKPNEKFDFREFAQVVNPKLFLNTIKIFKQSILAGLDTRDLSILTARGPDANKNIRNFLKDILKLSGSTNRNLKLMKITTLGDSNPNAKADWILERSKKFPKLKEIEFFDDSHKNRAAVSALESQLGNKIKLSVVDPIPLNKKDLEEKKKTCEGAGCSGRRRVLLNVKIGE